MVEIEDMAEEEDDAVEPGGISLFLITSFK